MLVERVVLGHRVVVVEHEARGVVLGAVDHTGLQCIEYLVVAHRHAVAAERVHHVDEHRVAHDAELHTLEVLDALDRLLGVVEAARASVHPAQAHQPGLGIVGDLVEQLLPDRPVDDLLHVRRVAEEIWKVEDVEIVDDRAERAHADPRQRQRTDLRLLDRFLFSPELHRRIDLHGDPPAGRGLELLAHAGDGRDRGITFRMDVRSLEHHLLLRQGRAAERRTDNRQRDCHRHPQRTALVVHGILLRTVVFLAAVLRRPALGHSAGQTT